MLQRAIDDKDVDSEQLRKRFLDEYLVDSYCALFNGYCAQDEVPHHGNRAFKHLDYLTGILQATDTHIEDYASTLRPAFEAQIDAYRRSKLWTSAINLCKWASGLFPAADTFRKMHIHLLFDQGMAELVSGTARSDYEHNEQALKRTINELLFCLHEDPYRLELFYMLGGLYHRRAVALANTGAVADALIDLRWAQAYTPWDESIATTTHDVQALAGTFKQQLAQTEASIAKNPGSSLSVEGYRLKVQLGRLGHPIDTEFDRARGEAVARSFRFAQARSLWKDIGLVEPASAWDECASSLMTSLDAVLADPPGDASGLRRRWQVIISTKPELQALDEDRVLRFISRRLEGEEVVEDDTDATTSEEGRAVEYPMIKNLPTRSVASASEPNWRDWLVGSVDWRLKAQCSAAIVLLGLTAILGGMEILHRTQRSAAYASAVAAASAGDELRVLAAGRSFFATPVFAAGDGREERVRTLMTRSIVRHLALTAGDPDTLEPELSAGDLTTLASETN